MQGQLFGEKQMNHEKKRGDVMNFKKYNLYAFMNECLEHHN